MTQKLIYFDERECHISQQKGIEDPVIIGIELFEIGIKANRITIIDTSNPYLCPMIRINQTDQQISEALQSFQDAKVIFDWKKDDPKP